MRTDTTKSRLPDWAPKIRRTQIEKFYRVSGLGIIDEEIIDDLGYSLYARCESVVQVHDAMNGKVACPACETVVERDRGNMPVPCRPTPKAEEQLVCDTCGWACRWEDYRATFKGKHLYAGAMTPWCRKYLEDFRRARSHREKLVLIDMLIHRFHGELTGGNKPGAFAIIDGRLTDIAAFLDRLNYGSDMPEDVVERRRKWRERVRTATPFWSDQLPPDNGVSAAP